MDEHPKLIVLKLVLGVRRSILLYSEYKKVKTKQQFEKLVEIIEKFLAAG